MKAQDIIDRAGILALDENHDRWLIPELIMWIGDALTQIVAIRPDTHPDTREIALVAGADQTLPDDATRLLDVTHNVVVDPNTSVHSAGAAITFAQRADLDLFSPGWKGGRKSSTVKHYMQEPRDPKRFLVYPPTDGNALVSVIVSTLPVAPESATDTLDLDSRFQDAVVAYVLFRCYAKDGEHTERASDYAGMFASLMQVDKQTSIGFAPNQNKEGGKPNAAALSQGGVS